MLILIINILCFITGYFVDEHVKVSVFPSLGEALIPAMVWILGHSISTFFAIIFKKNKIRYAILSYIGFKFALGIILSTAFMLMGIKNTSTRLFSIISYPSGELAGIGLLLLSAVF